MFAGGTIDNANKLIYVPSPNSQLPAYYVQDVSGFTDGVYWATKRWKKYDTVFRTVAPSYWFSTDSTEGGNNYPHKVFSTYAQSGRQYKISFYWKVGGPSWIGEVRPTLRLNGAIVHEPAFVTAIASDWELVEYTMEAVAVTDGELSLDLVVNQNINDLYLDDFSVTDVTP